MNKIIVLCGKSSAGKDRIATYLSKHEGYKFITSTTTRPMRERESQGNPYNFITQQKFLNKINNGDFIECRKYNTLVNNIPDTWYYGVEKSEVNLDKHSYVVVLDIQGLKDFKKHFGNQVLSFYINVDDDIREDRARSRGGFNKTEWDRRLEDDNKVFNITALCDNVDYFVNNFDFDKCVEKINFIIERDDNSLKN